MSRRPQTTCGVLLFVLLALLISGCGRAVVIELSAEQQASRESTLRELLETAVLNLREPGGLPDAEAALRVARDLAPDDPRVLDGLGSVRFRQGKLDQAEQYFREAILAEPAYDRAYAHLALVAEAQQDLSAARALLSLALRLNPMNFRARNNLALLSLRDGREEEAVEEFLRAYQTAGPGDVVLEFNRSLAVEPQNP
ncbi:MAG: tetratricopeptide repeat protein [Bdellovibrionales bacterium]|nr:tetratricopeptide repeat protein [Bdellovibrionales bacterium]